MHIIKVSDKENLLIVSSEPPRFHTFSSVEMTVERTGVLTIRSEGQIIGMYNERGWLRWYRGTSKMIERIKGVTLELDT